MNLITQIALFCPLLVASQVNPICFHPPGFVTTPAVGYLPHSLCTEDFNSDGKKDLLVVNAGSNDLTLLFGDGTGNFTPQYNFLAGPWPRSICTANFNNDSEPDIAVSGADVRILLGTTSPSGSFSIGATYQLDSYPFSIVAGDFNLDGNTDIATATIDSANITVMMGLGNGSFANFAEYPIGPVPRDLCTGDFNGDGFTDIAAANYDYTHRTVSVLFNNGFGGFLPAASYSVNYTPLAPVAGDFNNDGRDDITVIGFGMIEILLSAPGNTFSYAGNILSGGSGPCEITAQDYNGDGFVDLASSAYSPKNVYIYAGAGNGTFLAPVTFSVNNGPIQLISSDFNADSKPDIAIANYNSDNVSVLINGYSHIQITAPLMICYNGFASISVSGAQTYTWSNGITASTFTTQQTGTTSFTVTGMNSLGCINSASMTLNVVQCTALPEETSKSVISIYPNPSTGEIYLQKNQSQTFTLEIFDALGREILNLQITNATTKIDLNDLAEGIYFLRTTHDGYKDDLQTKPNSFLISK